MTKSTDLPDALDVSVVQQGNDDPAKMGQAIALLAAGHSCRQIAKIMGHGWSKSKVGAFRNKSDVKLIVEQASRALLSRSLMTSIGNQALKMELAQELLGQAMRLEAKAEELASEGKIEESKRLRAESRTILKESYGLLKLADQAEARMLETVGMAPTRHQTPVLNFINAPTNQAIISPDVLKLLGNAGDSNLGKMMSGEVEGEDVRDYLDAEIYTATSSEDAPAEEVVPNTKGNGES